jgi:hypothetical protein
MSSSWEDMFPLTTVHKLSREISDHNPMILDTVEVKVKKNNGFGFEKRWIKDDDFLSRVGRVWHLDVRASSSLEKIHKKLKMSK